MKTSALQRRKHAGGRPPKFIGPRRPVTVTLPEATLQHLASIDDDRARAIVKATDSTVSPSGVKVPLVQVVEVSAGAGMIVVGTSRYLRKIPWLKLAEIAPGRFLLSIPSGMPVDSLEIAIADLLEDVHASDAYERELLSQLCKLMREMRRGGCITKAEMLFIRTRSMLARQGAPAGRSST